MRVLLDTNIYIQDFRFRTNDMRLLLDEAGQGRLQIIVPSVVFQETVRHFAEEAKNLERSISKLQRDATRRLGLDADSLESARLALIDEANNYEHDLRSILEDHHATFVDIPSVPHQQMMSRIISRRRPISDDGKRGYQDTLIWETILHLQESSDARLYFVSNDSAAFADPSDATKLAADLLDDVKVRCGGSEGVAIFSNLREFTDKHIKPSRELSTPVETSVKEPTGREEISSPIARFLQSYAEELIGASPDSIAKTTLPLEELEIIASEFSDVTIEDVFRIADDELGVRCIAKFRIALQGYIDKDIDQAVLGPWTRHAEAGFAFVRVRSKASLYVDMDLTFRESQQRVGEVQPTFSWAEVDNESPPS